MAPALAPDTAAITERMQAVSRIVDDQDTRLGSQVEELVGYRLDSSELIVVYDVNSRVPRTVFMSNGGTK